MADLDFAARTPLAHVAEPGRHGRPGDAPGVVLGEVVGRTLTLLIARKGAVDDVARRPASLGVTLPRAPRRVEAEGFAVVWAGPEQWLVVAEPRGEAEAERLVAACAPFCMVVDQSDARALVTIAGPQARATLAKGFPIDLHPRAFRPGDTALTLAAGMSAQIWQLDDTPRYEIAVARSYAGSFWHWLADSAAEYGVVVEASG